MKKYYNIKLETLYELGACDSQCKLFKEHFGEQVDLATVDVAKYSSIFDVNWLALKLFKGAAWEEYVKEQNAICAEYTKELDAIYGDYAKATYAEYTKELDGEYAKKKAIVFIKIYTRETGKAKP